MSAGTVTISAGPVNPDGKLPGACRSYRHGSFSYKFDVLASETQALIPYTVGLFFAEPEVASAGARRFNVRVNGVQKLTNYDIFAKAGGRGKVVAVKIPGIVCPFGILSVEFTGVSGEALVNALVVEKQPGKDGNLWRQAVHCGGGAVDGLAADQAYGANSYRAYRDYALRCYGAEAAEEITAIINQNEPFAVGGGEAEGTPPLGDNPDPAGNIAKADSQIATIDKWMGRVKDLGQRERLRLLRTRIWSTRCYNAITPSDKSDDKIWALANSFRDRVDDISSLGMLASFQNRYVKQYFTGNSQPNRLKAVDPDAAPPRVVVISPPTSSLQGQGVDIEARIIDDREQGRLSAALCYRQPGARAWEKLQMDRRCRAIFGCRIPGEKISALGVEYCVTASDGTNSGCFPVTAPELPASLVVEAHGVATAPPAPRAISLSGKTISWEAVGEDCFMYKIYRSTMPNFSPSIANYLCFVARGTTSLSDSENDYADQQKRGVYYYRVTAVDKTGNEGAATKALAVEYGIEQ